jgi:Zn-dependent peptidase ImmA (M78 family)
MTSRLLDKVEAGERAIIDKFTAECPVKLGLMARELGVSIKIASLRTGISGQIAKEDGRYVIRVNRHEARERQRFTIAHELAHYFLHRSTIDSSPDGIMDSVLYRSGEPVHIEFEANRLAADIVMPMAMIGQMLNEEFGGLVTDVSIEGLASKFDVSRAAMEIRLAAFVEA